MTFHIYRSGNGYNLSNGADATVWFACENEAVDAAVRMAQDTNALYRIYYWAP